MSDEWTMSWVISGVDRLVREYEVRKEVKRENEKKKYRFGCWSSIYGR